MTESTTPERVTAAWQAAIDAAAALSSIAAGAVAVGWATVELDRATSELAAALRLPGTEPFRATARSVLLGASVRVATGVLPGNGSLAVLEPDTEGRLAESLARLGEGPVAFWLSVDRSEDRSASAPGGSPGLMTTSGLDGPFGPEWIMAGDPGEPRGRHRLLVLRGAGTIPS